MPSFTYHDSELDKNNAKSIFTAVSADMQTCAVLFTYLNKQPLLLVYDRQSNEVAKLEGLPKFFVAPGKVEDTYQLALNSRGTRLYVALLNNAEVPGHLTAFQKVENQWKVVPSNNSIFNIESMAVVEQAGKPDQILTLSHSIVSLFGGTNNELELANPLALKVRMWFEHVMAIYVVNSDCILTLGKEKGRFVVTKLAVKKGDLTKKNTFLLPDDLSGDSSEPHPYFLVANENLICIGVHDTLYFLDYDKTFFKHHHLPDGEVRQLWINDWHVFCTVAQPISGKRKIQAYSIPEVMEFGEVTGVTLPFSGGLLFFPSSVHIVDKTYAMIRTNMHSDQLIFEFEDIYEEEQPTNALKTTRTSEDCCTPVKDKPIAEHEQLTQIQANQAKEERLSLADLKDQMDTAFEACVKLQTIPCFIPTDARADALDLAYKRLSLDFNHWLALSCSESVKAVIRKGLNGMPSYLIVDYPSLVVRE